MQFSSSKAHACRSYPPITLFLYCDKARHFPFVDLETFNPHRLKFNSLLCIHVSTNTLYLASDGVVKLSA